MAGSPVRELITRVKMQLDNSSVNNVNRAIDKIIHKLRNLDHAATPIHLTTTGSSQALHAIQSVQSAVNHLNHSSANVHIQAATSHINNALNHGQGHHGQQGQHQTGLDRLQRAADAGAAAAGVGAAVSAPVGLAVGTAIDFQEEMARVKAITKATETDFERLTKTAKDLGASTPHSAKEVAKAMEYLGMAGWKTEQIIKGLPAVLTLSTASGEDLARVSDIVSDDLTAFHMPAEQAGHMADVMAATATNANTNVSMMGETFKYAASAAGNLGYSLEDVAFASGIMANSGIKGEQAGTSLRSIMQRLIDPPKQAAMALERLGFSAVDANGDVKPFLQQIKELREAMKGLSKADRQTLGGAIAGMEASTGFGALMGASDEDFNKMSGAVYNSNGAAGQMANTMHDTTAGSIKDFKSAVEGLEIALGETLLEPLTKVTKKVTEMVRAFNEFATNHPVITGAIAAIAGLFGGLLVVLGIVGAIVAPIAAAVAAVGGAAVAMGALVIGAIMAIIGIIVLLIAYWDELKAWVSEKLAEMGTAIDELTERMSNAFNEKIEEIKTFFAGLKDYALEKIGEIVSALGEWLGAKIEWAKGAISDLGKFVSGSVASVVSDGNTDNRSYSQDIEVHVDSPQAAAAFVSNTREPWFYPYH